MDKWEIIYCVVGIVWLIIGYGTKLPLLSLIGFTFLTVSYLMYRKRKG